MGAEDPLRPEGRVSAHQTELALVRESFLRGRYKQCAALCQSLQCPDVSPLFDLLIIPILLRAKNNINPRPRKVTSTVSGLLIALSRHLS